jgi:hypothetical protein
VQCGRDQGREIPTLCIGKSLIDRSSSGGYTLSTEVLSSLELGYYKIMVPMDGAYLQEYTGRIPGDKEISIGLQLHPRGDFLLIEVSAEAMLASSRGFITVIL